MSKEATSFEAKVTGLTLGDDGVIWAQVSYYEPSSATATSNEPTACVPLTHCSIYLRAADLPGIKIGDKVQVALYLK